MDMMAAIQYILTAAQSLDSKVYYKKVLDDDTWACWCIILRKRAGMDKMDYHTFRRKYLLGCSGKRGEVLKQQLVIEKNLIITLSA